MEVSGKVFVVTGAANGIGRQVALELIRRGGLVAGADLNEVGLAETGQQAKVPERFSGFRLDIADPAAVAAFPQRVVDRFGQVDGLFNIAGIPQAFELLGEIEDDRIEALMRVNFFGTVDLIRVFLPLLKDRPDGAVIMTTSSISGVSAVPGAAIYGASKAALALFTEGLSQDLRRSKVTATCVIPGTIFTPLVAQSARDLGQSEKLAEKVAMNPAKAARLMVDATMKGRRQAVIGKDAKIITTVRRFSTSGAYWLSYGQIARWVYKGKR